mgnify:CR=1 FL=1
MKEPTIFSIQLADSAAVGHINAGLEAYKKFESLQHSAIGQEKNLDVCKVFEFGITAVTNLALGLELLVKIHHFQISGGYPFGHDIKKLGMAFEEEHLENLRKIYSSIYEDPKMDRGLELRISGGTVTGNVKLTH